MIVYRLYLERGNRVFHWLKAALLMGVAVIILAGVLEAHVPEAKEFLEQYRTSIDIDFGETAPHTIALFGGFQKLTAVRSLFWNRGWFAIYLMASLPFLMWFHYAYVLERKTQLQRYGLSITLFGLLFYTFVLIGSRGALIGFLFSILFYLISIKSPKKFPKLVPILPHAVLVASLLFPFLAWTEVGEYVLQERTGFFRAGLAIGLRNPFFGGGMEGFGWNNYTYLRGSSLESTLNSSHNQILQVFSGQGMMGFFNYICILLMVLWPLRNHGARDKRYLPLVSGFVGILVYSMLQEWFYLRPVQLFWWLAVLLLMIAEKDRAFPNLLAMSRKWRWPALAVILTGTVLVAIGKEPPDEFGLSKPKRILDKEWRWVTGKEGWYRIPEDTGRVILSLRNRSRAKHPLLVTVEIPPIYKDTIRFDSTRNFQVLKIGLPEGSEFDRLRIRCDRSFSPAENYRSLDSRKLCIFANLELIPLSQAPEGGYN
jgi:hypothetical protein